MSGVGEAYPESSLDRELKQPFKSRVEAEPPENSDPQDYHNSGEKP